MSSDLTRCILCISLTAGTACKDSHYPNSAKIETPLDSSAVVPSTNAVPDAASTQLDASSEVTLDATNVETDSPPSWNRSYAFASILPLLFLEVEERAQVIKQCGQAESGPSVICFLTQRYQTDLAAQKTAVRLYEQFGVVAGLETPHIMDGGYRGLIKIAPALPTGAKRKHLDWVLKAFERMKATYDVLDQRAVAPGVSYRYGDVLFKFYESVNRTTPNAYAYQWRVAYNVVGSLLKNADAVSETLIHELFHTNDADHHRWSTQALEPIHAQITKKCGTNYTCLTPYSPHTTVVRNGTYYSFQPGNGPGEYAAELEIRYFLEQEQVIRGKPIAKPRLFKCLNDFNKSAWKLFVDEMHRGVDLTPTCQ